MKETAYVLLFGRHMDDVITAHTAHTLYLYNYTVNYTACVSRVENNSPQVQPTAS